MINESKKNILEKINLNFEAKCLGANDSTKKFKSPPEMMDYFDESINNILYEIKGEHGILKKLDK